MRQPRGMLLAFLAVATMVVAAAAPQAVVGDVITAGYTDASENNTTSPAPLTVELVSIAVTPATSSILVGQSQQFTATGTFSDDSTQDITASVDWASSDTPVATVQSQGDAIPGLATALAAGTATITANADGLIQGTATLTVTAPPPSSGGGGGGGGCDCPAPGPPPPPHPP